MKCVDTGAGLERFAMILQNRTSIHEIDQYEQSYRLINQRIGDTVWTRIILDHLKTAILMMREGIVPSNTREGYLLRRALRRAMIGVFLRGINLTILQEWTDSLSEVIDNKDLTMRQKSVIAHWLSKERDGFENLMRRNCKYLDKIVATKELDAPHAFTLKTGIGIPEDLLEEFCVRHGIHFPKIEFLRLIEEHREVSRRPNK